MNAFDESVARVRISPTVRIPQVGFGTFQIPPEDTQRAVEAALQLGYRHIDTAAGYNNEAGVGAAVRASGLPRDEIFVTTKLRNVDQGADSARRAFEASLTALGIDVVDLYLIHWPAPSKGLYVETWQTLVKLHEAGAVRAVGVSNFEAEHLERIIRETGTTPAVDQLEVHPTFSQPDVLRTCAERGITVEAYSPLGQGADLRDPVVVAIADRIGATAAQVVLAWHIGRGRVVIPKSVHEKRMEENLAAGAVTLSDEDLDSIDALHRADGRIGGNPKTFAFPQTPEDEVARSGK